MSSTLTAEDIKRDREVIEAATEGPWKVTHGTDIDAVVANKVVADCDAGFPDCGEIERLRTKYESDCEHCGKPISAPAPRRTDCFMCHEGFES